jgi:sulfite oxidase
LTKARLDEFKKRGIPFGPITVPLAFPSQSWEDYEKFWKENDPRDAEDE